MVGLLVLVKVTVVLAVTRSWLWGGRFASASDAVSAPTDWAMVRALRPVLCPWPMGRRPDGFHMTATFN